MIILSILFFVTAILYSSVGFGGGSTYLALLLIWEIPYYIFPVIALFCNIIVVTGNSINYIRAGESFFESNCGSPCFVESLYKKPAVLFVGVSSAIGLPITINK